MAYVPGAKLQDDPNNPQNGAPAPPGAPNAPALGSTPSVGGTVAGSSPVAQSNATQGAGTGFVNIDRYLNANKGASQDVAKKANDAQQADQKAFGAQLQTTQKQMAAGTPNLQDPTKSVAAVTGATSDDMRNAAIGAAQQAINAKYAGPTSLGYDVGNTADAKRAAALENSQTAGRQIAADNGTLSGYNTGLSAIDRAIYGSASEQPALQQAQQAQQKQLASQGDMSNAIAHHAGVLADNVAQNAAATKKAFGDKAAAINADAQAQAQAAAAANSKEKSNVVPTAVGRATWDPGSGDPTAANFIDANKAGQLSAIGQVLGDPTLGATQAGTPYVAGHWNYNNPNPQTFDGDTAQGSTAVSLPKPEYKPTTQEIYNATHDMTPEQKQNYKNIRAQYPNMTPGQIADDVKNGTSTNQTMYGGHGKYNNVK